MLTELLVADAASYPPGAGQTLAGLKAINFIFGTNGSGKTTISRVIADPGSFAASRLTWSGSRELERHVYNSDFVTRNYAPQMAGIFTLGEAEAQTLREIEAAKAKVDEISDDIAKIEGTLGRDAESGKRKEKRDLRSAFEASCWDNIKTVHDPHFQGAFGGLRASKAKFCDRLLDELAANQAALVSLEELKGRAATVFGGVVEREARLAAILANDLIALELSPILAKKVVGKEDVDIAGLIKRLGNSDWVRQGRSYLAHEPDTCPFCQQAIDDGFRRELTDYFDETYLADLAAIDLLIESYQSYSQALLRAVDNALSVNCRHLDQDLLLEKRGRLEATIEVNQRQLARKKAEAGSPVELKSLEALTAEVVGLIEAANIQIDRHNAMVENLAIEQERLISEIWKCLLEDQRPMVTAYVAGNDNLDRAISAMEGRLRDKGVELAEAQARLRELEKNVTSVQPTVNAINGLLQDFGFSNFELATAGEHHNLYEIKRPDGSDATPTLSEGERNFVTFLYFYHLLKGSVTTSGMTNDRIVVFDDPVSSLDSEVLFIVSTLIKSILEEACAGSGYIKQVFVLTHNIYFHKEVSFDSRRQDVCRAHETFWIVRKINNASCVEGHGRNPIKTSYELLWNEVRYPQPGSVTLQNTLRRIIENYFKILGNQDKDSIIAKFDGRDKLVCASLFAWVNDGSHSFNDDLHISTDETHAAKYLEVFRQIFIRTEHEAHYRMMMGPEALAAAEVVVAPAEQPPSPEVNNPAGQAA